MSSIHPECPGSDPSEWLVMPADAFLRQEPDEEEDEEEEKDDRKKEDDEDDDTTNDGYSE